MIDNPHYLTSMYVGLFATCISASIMMLFFDKYWDIGNNPFLIPKEVEDIFEGKGLLAADKEAGDVAGDESATVTSDSDAV